MKELGLNQSDLARRMKVSKPYITKVLRQDVNFSFRTAAKLARALEMDFFPELREREEGSREIRNVASGSKCRRSLRASASGGICEPSAVLAVCDEECQGL